MKKVFEIEPDWYVAENKEELPELWLNHHGSTYEEMTGVPFPWESIDECDPDKDFKFFHDDDEELINNCAQYGCFGIGHTHIVATFRAWADISPKGFLASTEF